MRDARASASVASASEARARAKNREKIAKNREKKREKSRNRERHTTHREKYRCAGTKVAKIQICEREEKPRGAFCQSAFQVVLEDRGRSWVSPLSGRERHVPVLLQAPGLQKLTSRQQVLRHLQAPAERLRVSRALQAFRESS